MEQQISLNFINKATYSRADVVKYYQNTESLLEAEAVLFEKLSPIIKNAKMLDIGIGGGRTTKFLLPICNDYTGVDYVPQFAEETAEKYPGAKIMCCDATNLKEFEAETFDFVLFSYNGLDSISNEQRLLVFSEVYRVLKKGGTFLFSSHNRDYQNFSKLPWQRKIEYNTKFLHFFLYCVYHLPKHYKMKQHEIYTDDYAVVNDGDHGYSLFLYYISIDKQVKQLTEFGFSDIEAFNMKGEPVETDTSSHWIQYLAKKK